MDVESVSLLTITRVLQNDFKVIEHSPKLGNVSNGIHLLLIILVNRLNPQAPFTVKKGWTDGQQVSKWTNMTLTRGIASIYDRHTI